MANLSLERSLFKGSSAEGKLLDETNRVCSEALGFLQLGFFLKNVQRIADVKEVFISENRGHVSFSCSLCYPERVASVSSVTGCFCQVLFCLTQLKPGSTAVLHRAGPNSAN